MKREESKKEKEIRELSEQNNPYAKECPNRHLWSEGFRTGYKLADEPAGQVGEKPYYFIERIRDNKWLTGMFQWTHDPNKAWKTTDKIVLEKIVKNVYRDKCIVTEHLFINPSESKQDKEHSEKLSAFQVWEKRQKENLSDEEYRRLLFANNVIIKKQQPDKEAKEILKEYSELACNLALHGNDIYCVEIDDAIKAMKQYHKSQVRDELYNFCDMYASYAKCNVDEYLSKPDKGMGE